MESNETTGRPKNPAESLQKLLTEEKELKEFLRTASPTQGDRTHYLRDYAERCYLINLHYQEYGPLGKSMQWFRKALQHYEKLAYHAASTLNDKTIFFNRLLELAYSPCNAVARAALEKAAKIELLLHKEAPGDFFYKERLADFYLYRFKDVKRCLKLTSLLKTTTQDSMYRSLIAGAAYIQSEQAAGKGDLPAAIDYLKRYITLLEQVRKEEPDSAYHVKACARAYYIASRLCNDAGFPGESRTFMQRSCARMRAFAALSENNSRGNPVRCSALSQAALFFLAAGRKRTAAQYKKQLCEAGEKLPALEPGSIKRLPLFLDIFNALCTYYFEIGDVHRELRFRERMITIIEWFFVNDPRRIAHHWPSLHPWRLPEQYCRLSILHAIFNTTAAVALYREKMVSELNRCEPVVGKIPVELHECSVHASLLAAIGIQLKNNREVAAATPFFEKSRHLLMYAARKYGQPGYLANNILECCTLPGDSYLQENHLSEAHRVIETGEHVYRKFSAAFRRGAAECPDLRAAAFLHCSARYRHHTGDHARALLREKEAKKLNVPGIGCTPLKSTTGTLMPWNTFWSIESFNVTSTLYRSKDV
ncbi:MAG: hypothetical protein JW863_18750 [Chitinispirillaceae bacterium]|nr:hypothetical protein [Chitinispirillaceae bacterium]